MEGPDDTSTARSIIDQYRAEACRRYPNFASGESGITRAVEAMLASLARVIAAAEDPFATSHVDVDRESASGDGV